MAMVQISNVRIGLHILKALNPKMSLIFQRLVMGWVRKLHIQHKSLKNYYENLFLHRQTKAIWLLIRFLVLEQR